MNPFTSYKPKSDEDLMRLYQDGNQAAFDEVYRRYSKRLLHFTYRMLNHEEAVAQDVLHDVFMKIVEQPSLFDTSRNFRSWIFTVAANECRKHHRQSTTEESISIVEDLIEFSTLQGSQMEKKAFRGALRKELQLLSYEHRCIFILRFQEGLNVKEVSQIMDCSEGTVKSRSHHCLNKLSIKLADYNPVKS